MGEDFVSNFPAARAIFEQADATLGWSLSNMCFTGPAEDLALTRHTQPAVFTVELAILEALRSEFMLPVAFTAGHSLGEFSALTAAGSLTFEQGLELVRARTEAMAATKADGRSMAAVNDISTGELRGILAELDFDGHEVDIVCVNAPEQTVVAGSAAALDAVGKVVGEAEGRFVTLDVELPFHSRWMSDAAAIFERTTSSTSFQPPSIPVVANSTSRPYPTDLGQWPQILASQIDQPVRWLETVRFLCQQGVSHVLEVGPRPIVGPLCRATLPSLQVRSVTSIADIDSCGEFLADISSQHLDVNLIGRCLAHAAATRNDAPIDVADESFEAEVLLPYKQVQGRYSELRRAAHNVGPDDIEAAFVMLEGVMRHKRVAPEEQADRWEELSWLDRHRLLKRPEAAVRS